MSYSWQQNFVLKTPAIESQLMNTAMTVEDEYTMGNGTVLEPDNEQRVSFSLEGQGVRTGTVGNVATYGGTDVAFVTVDNVTYVGPISKLNPPTNIGGRRKQRKQRSRKQRSRKQKQTRQRTRRQRI